MEQQISISHNAKNHQNSHLLSSICTLLLHNHSHNFNLYCSYSILSKETGSRKEEEHNSNKLSHFKHKSLTLEKNSSEFTLFITWLMLSISIRLLSFLLGKIIPPNILNFTILCSILSLLYSMMFWYLKSQ